MLSMRCQSFSSLTLKKEEEQVIAIPSSLCSPVNFNLSLMWFDFCSSESVGANYRYSVVYLHVKTSLAGSSTLENTGVEQ